MALILNYPLNRIDSLPNSTAVQDDAYLVIETGTLALYPVPRLSASVYESKALYEAGGATPINTENISFAVINNVIEGLLPIPVDGKTYVADLSDNAVYAAFQNREDGVIDIEATAYLYLQKLLGGVIG